MRFYCRFFKSHDFIFYFFNSVPTNLFTIGLMSLTKIPPHTTATKKKIKNKKRKFLTKHENDQKVKSRYVHSYIIIRYLEECKSPNWTTRLRWLVRETDRQTDRLEFKNFNFWCFCASRRKNRTDSSHDYHSRQNTTTDRHRGWIDTGTVTIPSARPCAHSHVSGENKKSISDMDYTFSFSLSLFLGIFICFNSYYFFYLFLFSLK